jgi:hypothetical protein
MLERFMLVYRVLIANSIALVRMIDGTIVGVAESVFPRVVVQVSVIRLRLK